MLQSELVKDGNIDPDIMAQICSVFEGGKLSYFFETAPLTPTSMRSG
jgi:hypothetical protein